MEASTMSIESRVQIVELMRHLKLPLIAVELGVAEAVWATELWSLGLEKLYLIDIWEQHPEIPGCASLDNVWHENNWLDTIRKFKDKPNVIILKGLTKEMAKEIPDNSLGLVYVDADHSYLGVKEDIHTYWPKLVDGGIMAFHDFMNLGYGVNQAVNEFTGGKGIVTLMEGTDTNNWGAYIIKK
jgi:hypothetical protein